MHGVAVLASSLFATSRLLNREWQLVSAPTNTVKLTSKDFERKLFRTNPEVLQL
jgi:hypothetical protein